MKELMQSIASGQPVVLKIYSEHCPPCERVAPLFDSAREKYKDQAQFFNMNIKNVEPNFLTMRGIRSAPTIMLFSYGVEECRLTDTSVMQVEERIEDLLRVINIENDGYVECESCT